LRLEQPFIAPGTEYRPCESRDHKNKESRLVNSSESLNQIIYFYLREKKPYKGNRNEKGEEEIKEFIF